MTEAQWQKRVTDYCDWLRLRWHHEVDSRRSKSGFPDLVIVGTSVLFVELKADKGRTSTEQEGWIADLTRAGAEVHIWRPGDWSYVQKRLREVAWK